MISSVLLWVRCRKCHHSLPPEARPELRSLLARFSLTFPVFRHPAEARRGWSRLSRSWRWCRARRPAIEVDISHCSSSYLRENLLTLPKYLSSSSTYRWMISSVSNSLSSCSIAQQKYKLAYLEHTMKISLFTLIIFFIQLQLSPLINNLQILPL